MLDFTYTVGLTVEVSAMLAPSATVVNTAPSSENCTTLAVAVVSTSKNWYSVAEYSIAGNPHFVAL